MKATKPKTPDIVFETLESLESVEQTNDYIAPKVDPEAKTQRLTLDEANEFVIKNYNLEYWSKDEENDIEMGG